MLTKFKMYLSFVCLFNQYLKASNHVDWNLLSILKNKMPSLEKKWQPTSHNFKVRPPIKIKKPMFNSRIIFKDTLILVLLKKN